jgi:hypothetical protein
MSNCEVNEECEKIETKFLNGQPSYCDIYKLLLNFNNEKCPKNLINVKNLLKSSVNKIDENIKLYNLNNIYKIILLVLLFLINIFLIIIINRIF